MAILLDGISLPSDLIWFDEYGWSNVVQAIRVSITGSLVIQEATQAKGRTITLKGGTDYAWITKATADSIKEKVDTPDLDMTLLLHGVVRTVRFLRSGNKSPFKTREIFTLADPDMDHLYSFSIDLVEV